LGFRGRYPRFKIEVSGFKLHSSGLRLRGLKYQGQRFLGFWVSGIQGFKSGFQGSEFDVQVSGLRVEGLGFRV
jgi:hypothetical protein